MIVKIREIALFTRETPGSSFCSSKIKLEHYSQTCLNTELKGQGIPRGCYNGMVQWSSLRTGSLKKGVS